MIVDNMTDTVTGTINPTPFVTNVNEQTFSSEVLEQSKSVPVVVDFWADWCAPCRTLGPVLERLADEFKGAFILAKLDVDQNQQLAREYQVQGIPAVKAFFNGELVNQFTGALPEPQVRKFIQALLPSTADLYVKKAFEWELNNQILRAEANYRAALEEQSDHYVAMVGLGRALLKQGKIEEGMEILRSVPEGRKERTAADVLMATAEFQREAVEQNEPNLRAKIMANSADVPSRYSLACLLASQSRFIEAMDDFLEVIRRDRHYQNDAARKSMLALFTIIGENQEITHTYRRKLANVLF